MTSHDTLAPAAPAARRPARSTARRTPVRMALHVAGRVAVGAVHGLEDRRDAALQPGQRLGEPHRVLLDALAERGQHVLQHRGARTEQGHPVIAEEPPGQGVRAESGPADHVVRRAVHAGLGERHAPMVR